MNDSTKTILGWIVGIAIVGGGIWILYSDSDSGYSSAPSASKESSVQSTLKGFSVPSVQKESYESNKLACNPNYSGCLSIDRGDYDCRGGSGNGPNYTGRVRVIGTDIYGLDRDGDGIGCE